MARIEIPEGPGGENTRWMQLRPEAGQALVAFNEAVFMKSILSAREREVARMRIAQINQCPICVSVRSETAVAQGLSEALYQQVERYSESAEYSPREKLAIEFAERFALDHRSMGDEFWSRLRANYSDAEVVDLGLFVAECLGIGRLVEVLGCSPVCEVHIY